MTTGPVLTFDQVQSLWIQNGGNPGWAPLAAAIAMAESNGNTVALNNNPSTGDYSVGLWQINYFGNLLTSRTQSYGSPAALQGDPNSQAKAAIALSGNGANWQPWTNDAAWKAWVAHGSPPTPSRDLLAAWGAPLGGAGGGTSTTAAANLTGSPSSAGGNGGTGCGAKSDIFGTGGVLGVGSFHFTACEAKALTGGLCIGAGGAIAMVGVLIIVAWGLGHTGAGRAVGGVARVAGKVT